MRASTKITLKTSSSYQIEKKLWEKFENKFINKNNVKKDIKIIFQINY